MIWYVEGCLVGSGEGVSEEGGGGGGMMLLIIYGSMAVAVELELQPKKYKKCQRTKEWLYLVAAGRNGWWWL